MDTQGGGWTLISKVMGSSSASRWGYQAAAYRDHVAFGQCQDLVTSEDCKSNAYSQVLLHVCVCVLIPYGARTAKGWMLWMISDD